jgi:hypothetical protein
LTECVKLLHIFFNPRARDGRDLLLSTSISTKCLNQQTVRPLLGLPKTGFLAAVLIRKTCYYRRHALYRGKSLFIAEEAISLYKAQQIP